MPRAALVAAGIEPGDRVGDLGAEHRRVGRRRALGVHRRRRRARAAQHPVQGRRGGVRPRPRPASSCSSPSPTSSTPTTSSCCRAGEPVPALDEIVVLRGARAPTARSAGTTSSPRGDDVDAGGARRPRGRARPATTSPTSSSPRAPPAARRARCSPTARASRAYHAWADVVGLREGDRYLIVNPFFHAFGLQGRHPRLPRSRARRSCRTRCSTSPRCCERVAEERITMLPGPPTIYQSILDHPDLGDVRHVVAAARGHRRGAGPGRADRPHARRARLRDDRHRLRPHRATGIATMCRHDDDPETIADTVGPRDPRRRGAHRRRRRQATSRRRAGRGRGARLQRDARLLRRPRGDRRGDRRRRLAAHRRHRRDGRARLPAHHRPQEGHVHRRRVQRLPGRDREHDARRTRRRRRSRSSACPTTRMGEVGMRVRRPAPRADASTPTSSSRGAASRWPTTRCRAASRSSTRSRSTRAARCSSTSCRQDRAPSSHPSGSSSQVLVAASTRCRSSLSACICASS